MLGGEYSIYIDGLGSIFQYEKYNYMRSEVLEKYALASAEADYEDPW